MMRVFLLTGLVLLTGCRTREAFLGMREPVVVGVTTSGAAPEAIVQMAVLVDAPESYYTIDVARSVEAAVVPVLLDRGHALIARSDLDRVLAESAFPAIGFTDHDAIALGRRLQVPVVLVVRVLEMVSTQDGGSGDLRVHVAAQAIAVESGSVLWAGAHRGTHYVASSAAVGDVLVPVARGVARAFPARTAPAAQPEP